MSEFSPISSDFKRVIVREDVDCPEPIRLSPSEPPQKIDVGVLIDSVTGTLVTEVWCARAKAGNGDCGPGGPRCVFSLDDATFMEREGMVVEGGEEKLPPLTCNTLAGEMVLDRSGRMGRTGKTVQINQGDLVNLQPKEAIILATLMEQPGAAVPYSELSIACDPKSVNEDAKSVQMRLRTNTLRLRRKLAEAAGRDIGQQTIVEAVKSYGLRINVPRKQQ